MGSIWLLNRTKIQRWHFAILCTSMTDNISLKSTIFVLINIIIIMLLCNSESHIYVQLREPIDGPNAPDVIAAVIEWV